MLNSDRLSFYSRLLFYKIMEELNGNERDFILEMFEFISDLPTSFEALERIMLRKYGLDEDDFYLLKDELIKKLK